MKLQLTIETPPGDDAEHWPRVVMILRHYAYLVELNRVSGAYAPEGLNATAVNLTGVRLTEKRLDDDFQPPKKGA